MKSIIYIIRWFDILILDLGIGLCRPLAKDGAPDPHLATAHGNGALKVLAHAHAQLEPLRVAGNQSLEVGILTSSPVYELWLRPYLALNRHDIQLTLPSFDAVEQMPAEPFVGGRASAWRPARTGDIITVTFEVTGGNGSSAVQPVQLRVWLRNS